MSKRHDRLAKLMRKMPKITDEHAVRRFIALFFGFYRRCKNRHCRRAAQCTGEGAPCFDAFWWDMPEYQKVWFREMVKARVAGAKTLAEIEAAGLAGAQAQLEMEERMRAEQQPAAVVKSPRRPPVEPPAHKDAQSQPNRGPRLTAVTPRIAYKSVMFS